MLAAMSSWLGRVRCHPSTAQIVRTAESKNHPSPVLGAGTQTRIIERYRPCDESEIEEET